MLKHYCLPSKQIVKITYCLNVLSLYASVICYKLGQKCVRVQKVRAWTYMWQILVFGQHTSSMPCSKVAATSLYHLCFAVNLESLTCVCEAGRKILYLDGDRFMVRFRPFNSVSSLVVVNRLSSVMAITDVSLFSRELGVRLTSP